MSAAATSEETAWPELQRAHQAIVVVDMVESVRLMLADEAGVIDRWRRVVHGVRNELLPRHGGRMVKSLGDGMLIVFGNVPDAAAAAFAMMLRLAAHNAAAPATPSIEVRIGVHVADVVVDEIDVYGSGVNLAARLAGLAGPGEIVMSAAARDLLSDGVDGHVVDLGECFLKHFDHSVRAFRLLPAGACVHAGIASPVFFDERPALAVIPFLPLTDAAPGALGDAVAEAVIAALSHNVAIRVISLLSTRQFRSARPSLAEVGAKLSAAYLVTGSFGLDGTRLRIDAQLCDGHRGLVLWSQRLHAELGALFDGNDVAVQTIAARAAQEAVRSEVLRARSLPMSNLQGYTLYAASVFMLHRLSRNDFERARVLLDHLCQRYPRSAAPLAMLSKWHLLSAVQGWATDKRAAARQAQYQARRALALEPDHALALSMEAIVVAQLDGDLEQARRIGEAAVAANPQESHAWLNLGGIHSYLGNADAAEAMPQRAIELSPLDPARFAFDAFLAEGKITARKFGEAAQAARSSIRHNAMHATSYRLLTLALALDGRVDEARQAASSLLRVDPAYRVSDFERRWVGRNPAVLAERKSALLEAGLPP